MVGWSSVLLEHHCKLGWLSINALNWLLEVIHFDTALRFCSVVFSYGQITFKATMPSNLLNQFLGYILTKQCCCSSNSQRVVGPRRQTGSFIHPLHYCIQFVLSHWYVCKPWRCRMWPKWFQIACLIIITWQSLQILCAQGVQASWPSIIVPVDRHIFDGRFTCPRKVLEPYSTYLKPTGINKL